MATKEQRLHELDCEFGENRFKYADYVRRRASIVNEPDEPEIASAPKRATLKLLREFAEVVEQNFQGVGSALGALEERIKQLESRLSVLEIAGKAEKFVTPMRRPRGNGAREAEQ